MDKLDDFKRFIKDKHFLKSELLIPADIIIVLKTGRYEQFIL